MKYNNDNKDKSDKIPVRKGCKNEQCFCNGSCREIIGYRDRLPGEK